MNIITMAPIRMVRIMRMTMEMNMIMIMVMLTMCPKGLEWERE